jgi:hypothetical protein
LRWSLSDFSFQLEKAGDDIWSVLGPALIRQN